MTGATGAAPGEPGGDRRRRTGRRFRGRSGSGAARRLRELTPGERRRATAVSAGRSVLATATVVALYYVLPLNGGPADLWAVLRLVLGALLFIVVMVFELRRILRAGLPQLRAVEGLALALPLFVTLFAGAYVSLAHLAPGSFTQPLNRTAGLYFAVVTLGTVGYGDIAPKTDAARILVSVQILVDLAFLALLLRLFVGAARLGLSREEPTDPGGAADPGGSAAPRRR
ncbi:potassium channel family protein [Streptacidiphilus albus]|uniref:potassium channel family protein n=1 Tax=Streptacidiphilus albus TaxID=105425 RepID=UPI00068B7585|nr:potassium channel family protein [Streptacidiphilus albus]